MEFPIRTIVRNVPRLPNLSTNIEEDNLFGSIPMSHNSHTHTGNTRQSEPQLMECSCSSAIPSHNSRDVISSHNSRNSMCLPTIPSHNSRDTVMSHNSRNTPTSRSLKYHPKPCRPRTSKAYQKSCLCIIAWRCSRSSRWNQVLDRLMELLCRQVPSAYDASDFTDIA